MDRGLEKMRKFAHVSINPLNSNVLREECLHKFKEMLMDIVKRPEVRPRLLSSHASFRPGLLS